jgi:WD40 repeat protein
MLANTVKNHTWLLALCLTGVGVWGLTTLPPRVTREASVTASTGGLPGTIYCCGSPWNDKRLWQMSADDKSLRPLPEGVWGEPSRQLHAGHRWFVDVRPVEGQSYPDGGARQELFASCDDGQVVRLTDMPDVEPMPGSPRWPLHGKDSMISWIGRRWDAQGGIVEQGIYAIAVRYDSQGRIATSPELIGRPVVSLALTTVSDSDAWYRAAVPDVDSHDWSPDGRAIAMASVRGRLSVADVKTGETRSPTSRPACDPSWSPDGRTIAFKIREPLAGIAVISSDGSDFEPLFGRSESEPFAVGSPQWSPSGDCVAFGCLTGRGQTPEGSVKTNLLVASTADVGIRNLTGDMPKSLSPIAWR